MPALGVSVYPDITPLEEIIAYLERAAQYGYTRVFSSMFSVEGEVDEVLSCFSNLNRAAHAHHMEVSLDVNPAFMARIGATPTDLSKFADIRADILRMDGAYQAKDNSAMLANPYGIKIEYNASALDPSAVEKLIDAGCARERILACHNFYPQRYTGFRWDHFRSINERLSRLSIRIGAFVSSQVPDTHGVWNATSGLPSVERMRDYPADLAARLLAAAHTTDILFGNAFASNDELQAVAHSVAPHEPHYTDPRVKEVIEELVDYGSATLGPQRTVRVEPLYDLSDIEHEILFDFFPHIDMGDSSEWIWRNRLPRLFYQNHAILPRRFDGKEFPAGSVLIVNDTYKHYAGELQVALRPLSNDGTRNLVARIDSQELDMFDVINDMDVVFFLPTR